MNNWDARDEGGQNCTVDADMKSIEKTCKVLGIEKIHQLNYQSSYWQRVFSPVIDGYQSGAVTPNPDILCNREIKFGEFYQWAIEGAGKCDLIATGHYARINGAILRQACDLGKDQTYFLSAINRSCLNRTLFPVGDLIKKTLKTELVKEAGLLHLLDRKESMGLCFVGKRGKFQEFMSPYVQISGPGRIVNFQSGEIIKGIEHKGLSNYTIGQKIAISGAKTKLYAAEKCQETNTLSVVDSINHPALWTDRLIVRKFDFNAVDTRNNSIYCTIRSVDKNGVLVESVTEESGGLMIKLKEKVFAPCPGQWAVFYLKDELSTDLGRICLGGSSIML